MVIYQASVPVMMGASAASQRRAQPQVINDQMLLLGAACGDDLVMYSLDLNTWIWTKPTPRGISPPRKSFHMASWNYKRNTSAVVWCLMNSLSKRIMLSIEGDGRQRHPPTTHI